jgi:hypothetical protein
MSPRDQGLGRPFDPHVVHAKYREERDKRLVDERANIRDLTKDELFARYPEDPFTPRSDRASPLDEV